MAVVPFRVSGAAADPDAEQRLLQVGGFALTIRQHPSAASAARHLAEGPRIEWPQDDAEDAAASASGRAPDLSHVGLVVWSSAVVLSDWLLRRPPLGDWPGVRVLELGCGTGAAGMFLAAAGARVVLSDLPHITPLASENVAANCGAGGAAAAPLVVDYGWGEPGAALRARAIAAAAAAAAAAGGVHHAAASQHSNHHHHHHQQQQQQQVMPQHRWLTEGPADSGPEFDLIVGADLIYSPPAHLPLLESLSDLAAPHTQVHLAFRDRGLGEAGFLLAAADAGWAVQEVPVALLHAEFQGGEYRVVAMCKL